MKRLLLALVSVGLLVSVAAGVTRPTPGGRVYTVPQFVAQLTRNGRFRMPQRGQVFRVHGELRGPAWMAGTGYALGDKTARGFAGLGVNSAPPIIAFVLLRRVPVLGGLVPPTADQPLTGQLATYQVVWVGCPGYPRCQRSPWQLASGGEH